MLQQEKGPTWLRPCQTNIPFYSCWLWHHKAESLM